VGVPGDAQARGQHVVGVPLNLTQGALHPFEKCQDGPEHDCAEREADQSEDEEPHAHRRPRTLTSLWSTRRSSSSPSSPLEFFKPRVMLSNPWLTMPISKRGLVLDRKSTRL